MAAMHAARTARLARLVIAALAVAAPLPLRAQAPAEAGQSAFAAIGEVVRRLEADPTTDWSRVNIEQLRAHLIDMNEVTVRADITQSDVPGGARLVATGTGRTRDAIRRMTQAHALQFGEADGMRVTVEHHAEGAVVTIVARRADDTATALKIRALGLVGFLALGGHHGPHHLAIASGAMPPGHDQHAH